MFDAYAPTFDVHLQNVLRYQVPVYCVEMIEHLSSQKHHPRMLDLGCGTGLVMEEIKKHGYTSTFVHGIDISPNMLEMADKKQIYDQLDCMDISMSFQRLRKATSDSKETYNLIVAGDVFVYFGDLQMIFADIRDILCVNGLFVFDIKKFQNHDLSAPAACLCYIKHIFMCFVQKLFVCLLVFVFHRF